MRWLLLLLALMIGAAQSQEKTPPKVERGNGAKQSGKQQIGTDARPLVVVVPPTEEDRKEAEALRETVESQERSERAILFMGKLEPLIFPTAAHDKLYPGDKDAPWPRIGYCFVNLGRTAAIIDRIEVKLILKDKLPPNTGYEGSQAMDGETVLPSGGTTRMYPAMFDRHLTKAEIEEVRNETKHFYLFGFTRYDDIFGYVHSYSFCFQFLPKTNSVFVTGGEQYNFRHTQKKQYEIR